MIHIVNIFIPTITLMFLFLTFMTFKRYWEFLLLSLLDVPLNPMKGLMHSIVWIFCGPLLLAKLFVLDIITCGSILLNFRSDEHMDILELGLSTEERQRLVDIFTNIETVARHLVYDKKIKKSTVKSFLFEVSVFYAKDLLVNKIKDNISVDEDDKEEQTKSSPTQRFQSLYKALFNLDDRRLYPIILRKYVSRVGKNIQEGQSGLGEIDLLFMLRKFKYKINQEDVHRLMSFDRPTLELARSTMQSNEAAETKSDLKLMKQKMDEMSENINLLLKLALKNEQPK